jgi:Xaa-Pro dipeptidase
MTLQLTPEEFAGRRRRALKVMAGRGPDALLMFKLENMHWLAGYDSFGYCFCSAGCCARTAIWSC